MKKLLAVVLGIQVAGYGAALAASCKDYRNCRQAVIQWCAGNHPRADGDGDGIPCENVCKSLAQVERIKKEIGCEK